MDENLLFIPSCCVDKKLPTALFQAPRNFLCFYTHGDVMMEKFYRSVSHLVVNPHIMVLSMPFVANDTLAFIAQCFERKWITDLVLSTQRDYTNIVSKYLGDYSYHVSYVFDNNVSDLSSHLVLYNSEQSLIINGPMYDRPCYDKNLVAYTMMFFPSYCLHSHNLDWGNSLRNVLFVESLSHRKKYMPVRNDKVISSALQHFIHMEFPPITND